MRFILPLLILVLGLGGGVGAGLFLRPQPEDGQGKLEDCHPRDMAYEAKGADPAMLEGSEDATEGAREYVKLNNQFVVPVVSDSIVDALVVMSLSIEIKSGQREAIYSKEPKLRDALLQVMFDHANMGGFAGAFTDANNLDILRGALTEAAVTVMGRDVTGVLIVDLARQDV